LVTADGAEKLMELAKPVSSRVVALPFILLLRNDPRHFSQHDPAYPFPVEHLHSIHAAMGSL